jgi:crossover junction endodeoxyribonuclease RuvC
MLLLGLDPGLRHTGWGLLEARGNQLRFVACGVVHTDSEADLARRLGGLYNGLASVIA